MKWLNPEVVAPASEIESSKKDYRNTKIEFTENSKMILERRYLLKDEDGNLVETPEEMFERVASVIASGEKTDDDKSRYTTYFYNLLSSKKFFPNSPTFRGAGTRLGQLAACFVLPLKDDLGKDPDGIFSVLRSAALIQQSGGGNGFPFSNLRPKGSLVRSSNGKSSGPLGFLRVFDTASGEIAQGGARRGANMAVMRVDHPDVRDFITCKAEEGKITNFNISIALTDDFMEAVEADTTYDLIDPNTGKVTESPRAREIFDLIVAHAYKNGEPGVLFIDTANKTNPVPHLYELQATNPCGEQWLGPYENCCLGSINLAKHVRSDGTIDWNILQESIELAVRFLDDVVTVNKYVPAVPQIKEAALRSRRIGLGFMGLADAMYLAGIRYGSKAGMDFAGQVMEFIRYHAMRTSIALARERGAFPAISGSIYDPTNLKWKAPRPLYPFEHDFGRPELNWNDIVTGIKEHGIRNAAQTTIAPTGTISTVAGVEGYGCEPVFALAYKRHVFQAAGQDEKLSLNYVSPLFERALTLVESDGKKRNEIIEEIIKVGTCRNISGLPEELKNVFVVSADITPEEHVKMQASLQAFVDNSISKTCNLPSTAKPEDVANVYKLGWKLGVKGLTVYVAGSRETVVLEVPKDDEKKSEAESKAADPRASSGEDEKESPKALNGQLVESRKRAYKLQGTTYKINTPQGKAFVVVNSDEHGAPFEVFVNVGKAGSDVAALSEALGRLVSGWLRLSRDPLRTVKEIVEQLIGIGGAYSVGFGRNRVSSIPDAVAKVLADAYDIRLGNHGLNETSVAHVEKPKIPEIRTKDAGDAVSLSPFAHADVCPECGNTSLILEEGCAKCYVCGYSRC